MQTPTDPTASASSSSARAPAESEQAETKTVTAPETVLDVRSDPALDLVASGRLPVLPRTYLKGRDLDLLAPLRFVAPGKLPDLPPPTVDRRDLAAALEESNTAYGHPRAIELAGRLAASETRVVVTGQQPGLFGGPLYTLSKMVAAVRWAERLEVEGLPAIAVFWVATEDHDFAEVSRASFFGRGTVEAIDLGDDPQALLPLGMRTFGEPVAAALDDLAVLGGGDRHDAWVEELRGLYRPDTRFGEAFNRLAVRLLGDRCPLILDSMLPGVKAAEQPWLERLVERREALEAAYTAADREIVDRGYPLQVAPQRGVSPLFLLSQGRGEPGGKGGRSERRRIEWSETFDSWSLRGVDSAGEPAVAHRPIAELLAVIEDNPGAVSPGVLARPAIQDAILGTTLQVLGPGEMSYMAQAAAAYPVLGIAAPSTTLRPQILVVEPHHATHLEEFGLSLGDMLGPADQLEARMADGKAVDRLDEIQRRIMAETDGLRELLIGIDTNLERPWVKTRGRIEQSLKGLVDRATAASARRDETAARRIDRLRRELLPGGGLQERTVSTAHFPRKYGDAFVAGLFEQMSLDGSRLQVIRP